MIVGAQFSRFSKPNLALTLYCCEFSTMPAWITMAADWQHALRIRQWRYLRLKARHTGCSRPWKGMCLSYIITPIILVADLDWPKDMRAQCGVLHGYVCAFRLSASFFLTFGIYNFHYIPLVNDGPFYRHTPSLAQFWLLRHMMVRSSSGANSTKTRQPPPVAALGRKSSIFPSIQPR